MIMFTIPIFFQNERSMYTTPQTVEEKATNKRSTSMNLNLSMPTSWYIIVETWTHNSFERMKQKVTFSFPFTLIWSSNVYKFRRMGYFSTFWANMHVLSKYSVWVIFYTQYDKQHRVPNPKKIFHIGYTIWQAIIRDDWPMSMDSIPIWQGMWIQLAM